MPLKFIAFFEGANHEFKQLVQDYEVFCAAMSYGANMANLYDN